MQVLCVRILQYVRVIEDNASTVIVRNSLCNHGMLIVQIAQKVDIFSMGFMGVFPDMIHLSLL